MYAVAKEDILFKDITDKITNEPLKILKISKGTHLLIIKQDIHPHTKMFRCTLEYGAILFYASKGFRLDKFKIVTNIAIPKMWYKLLNSIKPKNNG